MGILQRFLQVVSPGFHSESFQNSFRDLSQVPSGNPLETAFGNFRVHLFGNLPAVVLPMNPPVLISMEFPPGCHSGNPRN